MMRVVLTTTAFHVCASRSSGKERDIKSKNDYFGARYYASSMGRWLSPDLVNVTEDRMLNASQAGQKFLYLPGDGRKLEAPLLVELVDGGQSAGQCGQAEVWLRVGSVAYKMTV